MGSNKALTLYELNSQVKDCLEGTFPFPVWVVAEISEITARQHCYLELVQKDESTDKLIAKSRANIWAYTYKMLKPYFETTTGYALEAGIKVMLRVEVQYSELYGFSLSVKDIDPTYTLGDVERQRKQVLNRLEEEGILEMNKTIALPLLPKTIAVISSPQAAGYQDFLKQIEECATRYKFHVQLFPAIMQGEQAVQSIVEALEKIYEYEEVFDAVVLIRGGGAVSDLACFDAYDLVVHLAQFPLPVLTGIGHDRDVSIADLVAHTSLKTPTAVADFLIHRFNTCENEIKEKSVELINLVDEYFAETYEQLERYQYVFKYILPQRLQEANYEQTNLAYKFQRTVENSLRLSKDTMTTVINNLSYVLQKKQRAEEQNIDFLCQKIQHRTHNYLSKKNAVIDHKECILELLSPEKLLRRGYSITTLDDGSIVRDIASLKKGTVLQTQFSKGIAKSIVSECSQE